MSRSKTATASDRSQLVILKEKWEKFPWALYRAMDGWSQDKNGLWNKKGWLDILGNWRTRAEARAAKKETV